MYDVIIIGAGPAGLTAALYLGRARKKVLILEALSYGGKIINTLKIDNYPSASHISGYDFATNLYNQVMEYNIEIKYESVININNYEDKKEVITRDNKFITKTIIIATGNENRKLGLNNEKELIGKGISYCATCDGPFFKEKDVAVVGGGNNAIDDAIYLSDIVNKVYLIHRKDEFSADTYLIDKLKKKNNIEYIYNSQIIKINGIDQLESIEITDNDGKKTNLKIAGLFIAIGRIPETENLKKLIKVDDSGYIEADENCNTNIDGIFVAGDVRSKSLRQLVTATSDGAVAATEAIKYISNLK